MCGNESQDPPARDPSAPEFPWDAGAFDAHCHPTDTMSSIASVPEMKARILTIMATRSQDQDLVSDVASKQGLTQRPSAGADVSGRVVPSFGWHPWFSYQLVNDQDPSSATPPDSESEEAVHDFKTKHYTSVLAPPPQDPDFIAQLPAPTLLSTFLDSTRARASSHPVVLIGEIGLDKGFRLPGKWPAGAPRDESLTPGGREGRRLSPHGVAMGHQVAVLKVQLGLAGELGLPVSVHGVQAHGVLYDAIAALWKGHERDVLSKRERRRVAPNAEDWSSSSSDEDEDDTEPKASKPKPTEDKAGQKKVESKPFPPRICLHSFSGSTEVLRRYIKPQVPADIYFSLSTVVNLGTPSGAERFAEMVKEIPDERILVESDLHTAGPKIDEALEDMYRRVCEVKGWGLREGVERIGRNYEAFVFG